MQSGCALRSLASATEGPIGGVLVGGLTPFSTVDWPGMLAATVFTRGCAWHCPYCHNPHLLSQADGDATSAIEWDDVLGFLARRAGLLDGVVFSGGEPTLQPSLPAAIAAVRELGYSVALHTSGMRPDRLAALLPFLDWVGLDVKAPFGHYERVTGVAGSGLAARESLRALMRGGVEHEIRTTVHSELIGPDGLRALAHDLEHEGVRRWVVQAYRPEGVRPALGGTSCLAQAELRRLVGDSLDVVVRG